MKATIGKATKAARARSRSQRKEREITVDTAGRVHLGDGGIEGILAFTATDANGKADELEVYASAEELKRLALQIATLAKHVEREDREARERTRAIRADIDRKRAAREKEKARREAELGRPLSGIELLFLAEDVRDGKVPGAELEPVQENEERRERRELEARDRETAAARGNLWTK